MPRDRVLRRHPRLRRPRRVRSNVLSSGAIDYGVPSGRRDGLTSAASDASRSLPPPFARLDRLTELFAAKGFTQDELVTLSGAHSVGRAHCASFSHRIHIHPTVSETMDAQYGAGLQQRCPTDAGDAVDQDQATPADLDNQYYRNLGAHQRQHDEADGAGQRGEPGAVGSQVCRRHAQDGRLGRRHRLTGDLQGEVRSFCNVTNRG